MVIRHSATVADLLELPDADGRYELIDGEIVPMSPANPDHAWISVEIARLIANYASDRSLGEVFGSDIGYLVSRKPDTVLSPDASYVRTERLPPPSQWRSFFPFSPDIAVEVVSPSNSAVEMSAKTARYLASGSEIVVVVSPPSRSISVHTHNRAAIRLGINDELDLNTVIPGLSIPVRSVFRRFVTST